jgi:hypothetical protein
VSQNGGVRQAPDDGAGGGGASRVPPLDRTPNARESRPPLAPTKETRTKVRTLGSRVIGELRPRFVLSASSFPYGPRWMELNRDEKKFCSFAFLFPPRTSGC